MISDEKFSFIQADYFYGLSKNLRKEVSDDDPNPYCTLLKHTIPYFRNKCAHGSSMLNAQGGVMLMICAELINQLFEPPENQAEN